MKVAAFMGLFLGVIVCTYCFGLIVRNELTRPTEPTTLQDHLAAKDEQLASYRLYSSEIAKSLVDLNKQLRESQAECERLERENMRLERRAMGLSDESEP